MKGQTEISPHSSRAGTSRGGEGGCEENHSKLTPPFNRGRWRDLKNDREVARRKDSSRRKEGRHQQQPAAVAAAAVPCARADRL